MPAKSSKKKARTGDQAGATTDEGSNFATGPCDSFKLLNVWTDAGAEDLKEEVQWSTKAVNPSPNQLNKPVAEGTPPKAFGGQVSTWYINQQSGRVVTTYNSNMKTGGFVIDYLYDSPRCTEGCYELAIVEVPAGVDKVKIAENSKPFVTISRLTLHCQRYREVPQVSLCYHPHS